MALREQRERALVLPIVLLICVFLELPHVLTTLKQIREKGAVRLSVEGVEG